MSGGRSTGGFLGGLLATLPMTLWMVVANRWIPARKPDPLPPEEITENVTEQAPVQPKSGMGKPQQRRLVLIAHFSYGAITGLPLGWLVKDEAPRQAVATGIGYGLLVWGGSYMGLMPALNLYPPVTREPARMNGIMIAAHVIWGGAAGWLASRLINSHSEGLERPPLKGFVSVSR